MLVMLTPGDMTYTIAQQYVNTGLENGGLWNGTREVSKRYRQLRAISVLYILIYKTKKSSNMR